MMAQDAPDWIPWSPARWLAGTMELDRTTEFVFFRLCMIAYEAGDSLVAGSDRRTAMRCKTPLDEYLEAIGILAEFGKVEIKADGVYVPSTDNRIQDAKTRISGRRRGAAIARRRRELVATGRSKTEISTIINDEFPDGDAGVADLFAKTDERRDDASELKRAVDAWNEMAEAVGLPKVQRLSDERKRKLRNRLQEIGGISGWQHVVDVVRVSDFLSGRSTDWKCTFDFLLSPSSLTKVIEGNYANKGGPNKGKGGSIKDALERIRNEQ